MKETMPIRVLHSVSNMDRAGIETMLMNYYRHIDRGQVQFDFLCNKKKPGAYDDEIQQLGGRIFHTPGLNPARYPQYLRYMAGLFAEHPEYRVIEAHNGAFGVYALHAAKKNEIPVRIFHAHGTNATKDWKFPLKLVCKALLPRNLTHRFSCGTAAAGYYFGQKTARSGEFTFIPNAIEVERFLFQPELREKLRGQYALGGKHVIGHVGRFMAQKNHAFLLDVFEEAAKKDPDAVLVLLGDGELQADIQKRTEEKGLSSRVLFMGNVGNANEWYNAFDVFALPSLFEGLPVVGVEAQANDLPCVFSENVTREIAISDRAQFLSLNETKARWAEVLLEKCRETNRRNNRNLITENRYNIAYEAQKLQTRYLELAGERP